METRLFVGNLPQSITEEDLSNLFAKAGTVESVEVITVEELRTPKCFAFVDMSSKHEAERAIGMLDGSDVNRRAIKVKIALPREKRPAGGGWYTDPPPPNKLNRKGPSRRKAN